MPISLKASNSLESLAKELSQDLRSQQIGVFTPHILVTQTEGMNNWLRMQMAAHLGIAANFRFLKSNDLIFLLYQLLGGKQQQSLSGQSLVWLLYELMGRKDFISRFPVQSAYFTEGGPEKDLKRMELAEKTADFFDQYQIYRPEMIGKWKKKDLNGLGPGEWQAYLWIKAANATSHSLPDKTAIRDYIRETIRTTDGKKIQEQLGEKLPAVNLFGLSILTSYHIDILSELSAWIDIRFYIINPAPETYWIEDKSEKQIARQEQRSGAKNESAIAGNPLLTNWGKVLKETFYLLFRHEEMLNQYEPAGVAEPGTDSLLHKIQDDIFRNATLDRNPISATDLSDGSLTINSCYTIAREVEVLYNYLVMLVHQHQGRLSAGDIIVMSGNIDAYAPYIKAVFNNAPYPFRYSIADETISSGDNIYHALESILSLDEDNFKAEQVLQLLDSALIRKRFRITDTTRIREIVNAANIRFGIEGNYDDDTYLVSWRYGIRRIMYGICMSGGLEYGTGADSFYPLDTTEGQEAGEVIRFCHFIETLISSVEERKKSRSIADWVRYVEQVVLNLIYEPEDEGNEDYQELSESLSRYNEADEFMPEPVAYRVFSYSFLKTLGKATRASLFVNGGITFCSLIPMRSIPFKVVALLGLNYDAFPRKEKNSAFSLMGTHRPGDRNIRDNDKHLFLETIVSAKEHLYLSYTGRSVRDNSELPPSVLVDELIDYISSGTTGKENVRDALIIQHPLHGFSKKYNTDNERLYSFLVNPGESDTNRMIRSGKEPTPPDFSTIPIRDLCRFFRHPIQAYYNRSLGIYYQDNEILLPETEVFYLDSLQEWNLKNRLLHTFTEPGTLRDLQKQMVKTGELPLKNMAERSITQTAEAFDPVRTMFLEAANGAEETQVSIEIGIGDSMLIGTLSGIYEDRLVCASWSSGEMKYLADACIRYLSGVAAGKVCGLVFISAKKKQQSFVAESISQHDALRKLEELTAIYKQGILSPVAFMPDLEFRQDQIENLTPEIFNAAVEKKFFGYNSIHDPYLAKAHQAGIFAKAESPAHYLAIYDALIVPLKKLFPGYFKSK